MSQDYSIPYPRKVFIRGFFRFASRLLLALLARVTITGKENLPKSGPLILVGNHVALVEVIMMAMYVPYLIEIIGVGDIPLDPRFTLIINTYGYIPIKRGSVDSKGLNMALDVLKQGGVIGIFPEGGIWESGQGQARAGVAWLSHKADAPIVPIGFGGMRGALAAISKFKRPQLIMNIGKPIPAISSGIDGKSRKEALDEGANAVMAQVEALVPQEEKRHWRKIEYERFAFSLDVQKPDGTRLTIPPEFMLENPDALAKFFYRPVIIETLARNLKLPVDVLKHITRESDPMKIGDGAAAALEYFEANPQFLGYRFGYPEGSAMQDGLKKLRDTARWAAAQGGVLKIQTTRRFKYADESIEIVEDHPGAGHGL
jgi:1-acyl-sn-glycerol-3-phosphate acyltransferase